MFQEAFDERLLRLLDFQQDTKAKELFSAVLMCDQQLGLEGHGSIEYETCW